MLRVLAIEWKRGSGGLVVEGHVTYKVIYSLASTASLLLTTVHSFRPRLTLRESWIVELVSG